MMPLLSFGDESNDVLIQARWCGFTLDVRDESILVFCVDKVFDDLRGGGHGARGLIRPSMRETGRECRGD